MLTPLFVNTSQAGFTASLIDCNGNTQSDRGFSNPVSNILTLDLDACPPVGSCVANFTWVNGIQPLAYGFTDQSVTNSIFPINAWLWDFGDGNTSTMQSPGHVYAQAGTYNVCLIIYISGGGCSDTTCQTLVVAGGGSGNCQAAFNVGVNPNGVATFADISTPANVIGSSWLWDFGDGNISTLQNPTHFYTNSGTYTACLIYTNAICRDTSCQVVTVTAGNPCSARFTSTVLGGGAVQFQNSTTQGSSVWDFGDGVTSTQTNPTHNYLASGTYTACLIQTCPNNQMDTSCTTITILLTPGPNAVVGNVSKTLVDPARGATVYLITLDTQLGILTAVDTTITDSTGGYSFSGMGPGDYRIKAALDANDPDFASYLPTYHTSSLFWNTANVVTVSGNTTFSANIGMTPGNNPGGPGFIGGLISQGANKRDPGDPLENISILILDDQDNPVTHTATDANGEYSIANLAYGTYKVYVEVIGKDAAFQLVTLGPGSSSVTEIDFLVNSTYVAVGISETQFGKLLDVYPNPTSQNLNIDLSLDQVTELTIGLTDLMGRAVMKTEKHMPAGSQTVSLDISHLPAGMYTLTLISGKQILSKRIIRE